MLLELFLLSFRQHILNASACLKNIWNCRLKDNKYGLILSHWHYQMRMTSSHLHRHWSEPSWIMTPLEWICFINKELYNINTIIYSFETALNYLYRINRYKNKGDDLNLIFSHYVQTLTWMKAHFSTVLITHFVWSPVNQCTFIKLMCVCVKYCTSSDWREKRGVFQPFTRGAPASVWSSSAVPWCLCRPAHARSCGAVDTVTHTDSIDKISPFFPSFAIW